MRAGGGVLGARREGGVPENAFFFGDNGTASALPTPECSRDIAFGETGANAKDTIRIPRRGHKPRPIPCAGAQALAGGVGVDEGDFVGRLGHFGGGARDGRADILKLLSPSIWYDR